MSPPTHCSGCGRPLDEVRVPDGLDPMTGERAWRVHMRCPYKVTTSWQALIFGDKHDEFLVPRDLGPYPPGDPGPLLIEVKWR